MPELPMFPLGTVLMPGTSLPLHVFEARYRELVHDVLAGDGTFGVTLIRRGSEVGGGDDRHDTGTRARIAHAEELTDGRWLVVALGMHRLRVERWLSDAPYPRARVRELEDEHDDGRVAEVHTGLEPRLRHVLELRAALERGDAASPGPDPLSTRPAIACWQAPALSPLGPLDHQQLLEISDCAARLELLDDLLVGAEEVLTFRLLTGE